MTCTCLKPSTGLCNACFMKMLDEVRPVPEEAPNGWETIKATIKDIWPRNENQFEALNRLCDFLTSASDKSLWCFLGHVSKAPMYPGTGPTVWYHNGEINIQIAQYAKFLTDHHIPFVM